MSRLEKQIVKFKQDGLEIVGPSVVNGVEMNENEIKQYLETNERSREYYDIHLSVTELEDQLNVFSDYRTTLRNEVVEIWFVSFFRVRPLCLKTPKCGRNTLPKY